MDTFLPFIPFVVLFAVLMFAVLTIKGNDQFTIDAIISTSAYVVLMIIVNSFCFMALASLIAEIIQ